jgi:hypothetical protein
VPTRSWALAAGNQQVPRLRQLIRVANHSATLGMTELGVWHG